MSKKESTIEWTDITWNVARGCTKVNSDCKNCYMMRDSLNSTRYPANQVVKTKTVFNTPLKIKKPSKIFTSSLTDFFHPEIDAYRQEAWDIIKKCPQHIFQILTKRPERILLCLPPDWSVENYPNVWLGVSCGSQNNLKLAHTLLKLPIKAACFFLSVEPMHTPVSLAGYLMQDWRKYTASEYINFFDWIIVGGESGNKTGKYKYRPCEIPWISEVVKQCRESGTPCFVKQLGTYLADNMHLKSRHGRDMEEWPEFLRVRQFPNL